MKNPPHPGELVGDNLEALGVSVTDAAKALGISRQQLHNVIAGRYGITPEMAMRLEKALGSTADTWLGMQMPSPVLASATVPASVAAHVHATDAIRIRTDFIEPILEPLFLSWYLDGLKSSTSSRLPTGLQGTRTDWEATRVIRCQTGPGGGFRRGF